MLLTFVEVLFRKMMGRVKNTASLKRKNLGWKWWCNLMFSVFPIFLPLHMWGKKNELYLIFIYLFILLQKLTAAKEERKVSLYFSLVFEYLSNTVVFQKMIKK